MQKVTFSQLEMMVNLSWFSLPIKQIHCAEHIVKYSSHLIVLESMFWIRNQLKRIYGKLKPT